MVREDASHVKDGRWWVREDEVVGLNAGMKLGD